jgi:hypothetical protein
LAANGAVAAAAWAVAVGPVGMGLVAVVAAPAGQALEGGLGGLPVAAAAGRLPAGLGAQQPVDLVPLATGYRRPLPAVASAISVLAAAELLRLPAGPIGRLGGEPGGRCRRPPVPSHPAPAMLP